MLLVTLLACIGASFSSLKLLMHVCVCDRNEVVWCLNGSFLLVKLSWKIWLAKEEWVKCTSESSLPCVRHWLAAHYLNTNKGRFCNNSEIDTLISKRLSVQNKAKLSQLEIVNKQYYGGGVSNFQLREFRFVLYR